MSCWALGLQPVIILSFGLTRSPGDCRGFGGGRRAQRDRLTRILNPICDESTNQSLAIFVAVDEVGAFHSFRVVLRADLTNVKDDSAIRV
jgi:hypothetical protein